MNILNKLKKPSLSIILASLVLLYSCDQDEIVIEKSVVNELVDKLSENYGIDSNNVSYENIQTFNVSEKGNVLKSNIEDANFITIPIIENNKVVGRLIKSNKISMYIDLSKWNSEISAFSLENKETYAIFPTFISDDNLVVLDTENAIVNHTGNYRCSLSFVLCQSGCVIAGLAIAATDGPAPLMDIYAVGYTVTCTAGCGVSHCEEEE